VAAALRRRLEDHSHVRLQTGQRGHHKGVVKLLWCRAGRRTEAEAPMEGRPVKVSFPCARIRLAARETSGLVSAAGRKRRRRHR